MAKDASDIVTELASLRESIERLEQGLRLMLETQETQNEMLRQILQAAAVPPEPEQGLSDLLAELLGALNGQQAELNAIGTIMRRLPGDIGSAVAAAVGDGLKGL
jgi:hypothetical protein